MAGTVGKATSCCNEFDIDVASRVMLAVGPSLSTLPIIGAPTIGGIRGLVHCSSVGGVAEFIFNSPQATVLRSALSSEAKTTLNPPLSTILITTSCMRLATVTNPPTVSPEADTVSDPRKSNTFVPPVDAI